MFWLALASQPSFLEAKLQAGTVQLGRGGVAEPWNFLGKFGAQGRSEHESEEPWHFLGKFGFAIGTGKYSLRLRLREPLADPLRVGARVDFNVFLDEDWDRVAALPVCRRAREGPSRRTRQVSLGSPGRWGPWMNGTVHQAVRAHIWYFVLNDCRQELGNGTNPVDFELHTIQFDGSEFGVEMRRMLPANSLALLGLTVLLVRYAARCSGFRQSAGALHPVIWGLAAAVGLQWCAQALHTMHLWSFGIDGVGLEWLDAFSEHLSTLGQVGQTALLIAIAMGYTLLHAKLEEHSVEFAFPGVVLHVLLVFAGHLGGQAKHRHHAHEGAVGWALLSVRALLYLWFLHASRASLERGGARLRAFLVQFRLAGSVYFLSYPALFALVQLLAPYLRHPVLQLGTMALQTAANVWLAELFLARGAYFKASALSSALLPGGAGGLPVGLEKSA